MVETSFVIPESNKLVIGLEEITNPRSRMPDIPPSSTTVPYRVYFPSEPKFANLGSDGKYTLYGTVVDEGGISGILERGFVISSKPITNLLDSGITKLVSTINDNNFSSSFTPTLVGKKHYFRAYAINAENDFLGTEETFIPAAIPGPGYWSDAKALASDQ